MRLCRTAAGGIWARKPKKKGTAATTRTRQRTRWKRKSYSALRERRTPGFSRALLPAETRRGEEEASASLFSSILYKIFVYKKRARVYIGASPKDKKTRKRDTARSRSNVLCLFSRGVSCGSRTSSPLFYPYSRVFREDKAILPDEPRDRWDFRSREMENTFRPSPCRYLAFIS